MNVVVVVSLAAWCEQRTTAYEQHSCIYKPSEMVRKIVCLRYLLTVSFVILGISGGIVCATGSYHVHQLRGTMTNPVFYGPPAILLTTGILNIVLASYFWFSFDTKYNLPQLYMFLIVVILVASIQTSVGIWAIVIHRTIDLSIIEILEKNLAAVGTNEDRPRWNTTEIKVNCCGFENSMTRELEISGSCCKASRYNGNNEPRDNRSDECRVFYDNECRHYLLHHCRSVLFDTFVLALCATIVQVFQAICLSTYKKISMKKLRRQSLVVSRVVNRSHLNTMGCPPTVSVGQQHVCEGCLTASQYQSR